MKRVLCIIAALVMMAGCGASRRTPQVDTRVEYTYKDSTAIKDSLRIIDLPVERIVDRVAVYDTLVLEP